MQVSHFVLLAKDWFCQHAHSVLWFSPVDYYSCRLCSVWRMFHLCVCCSHSQWVKCCMTMDLEVACHSSASSLVGTHLQPPQVTWLWLVHVTKVCHHSCFSCFMLLDLRFSFFTYWNFDVCVINLGLPSVLWHYSMGGRKGIRPDACKKTEWRGAGVAICLECSADLHMAQLMPLPLTVSDWFYLYGTGWPG